MAVRDVIARHAALIWSIARRSSADSEAAELGAQQVFTELWKHAGRFDPAVVSETLFVTMLTRRWLLERRTAEHARPSPRPDAPANTERPPELEHCPEAMTAAGILASLAPAHRRALSLAFGQGMTPTEVADLTGLSRKDARLLGRRALVAVRKRLPGGPGPGPVAMSGPQKRLHTLLTDRAIAGLDPRERAEFDHLLAGAAIDPSYEAAGAAIELVLLDHTEPPPAYVEAAIIEQAGRYWGFTSPRPHEQTIGGGELIIEPSRDDILLHNRDDGPPVVPRVWEQSPGLEAAIDAGVLESSLTDGRIDKNASPTESQRGEILRELRPGPGPRSELRPPRPAPTVVEDDDDDDGDDDDDFGDDDFGDDDFGDDDFGDDDDLEASTDDARPERRDDPTSVSQSDLGPATSAIVRMPASESRLVRWMTYFSAIAALMMLTVALWLYAHRSDPPDPELVHEQVEATTDKLEWTFTPRPDEAVEDGASGTVLWSSELQEGVLLLDGLALNEPAEHQYQLWIHDKQREGPPVDGGVFDVSEDGELRVPIDAKLVIGEPAAFLITVERPGGVVVSDQERVAMVATPAE